MFCVKPFCLDMFNQPVVKILCSILRIAILVGAQSSEMTPTELIHWKGADSQVLSSDDCSFNSTNMNSVYVESSNQCGSECFKRNVAEFYAGNFLDRNGPRVLASVMKFDFSLLRNVYHC